MWLIRDMGVGKTTGLFPDKSIANYELEPCQNIKYYHVNNCSEEILQIYPQQKFKYRYWSSTKKISLIGRVFDFFKRKF